VVQEVHHNTSTEPEGVFSRRRRAFSAGTGQGEERKKILQAVQTQAKEAACAAITEVLEGFLEAEVSARLGREQGERRRVSVEGRPMDWRGGYGGWSNAHPFTRDGHSRRDLATGWGVVRDVRVPLGECQECQYDVVSHGALLEKHHRFWMDVDQQVLVSSGGGESVRPIQERWSVTVEGSVGRRTLNERIHQIESLARLTHREPIQDVPSVLQLDGIWVTIQSQQETVTPDTRQRPRHQRTGRTMVILVALGFWPDGRREILDGQMAKREDHQEWDVLVQRRWERGRQPETG